MVVLRSFRFHQAGIERTKPDDRYVPKLLHKIRFVSGMSKNALQVLRAKANLFVRFIRLIGKFQMSRVQDFPFAISRALSSSIG